jgi:hypothetical protein
MNNRIPFALVICFIALSMVIYIYFNRIEEPFVMNSNKSIPKIIWSYWDNPDTVPKAVHLCKKSWEKYNPEYEIRLLHKSNYQEYAKIPDTIANHPRFNDMPQRFADLLRLYLIAEHGGIWCDSSILANQSFDSWLFDAPNKELYAFTIDFGNHPERAPVIENWFFAAPPQSPFVKAWLEEFLRMKDFNSADEYVGDLAKRGVDAKDWCCGSYLAMHHSAAKLMQLDKYPVSKLQLWPSEKGPYRYLVKNGWNAEKSLEDACTDKTLRMPFMKMRGGERGVFENGLNDRFSENKCHWSD